MGQGVMGQPDMAQARIQHQMSPQPSMAQHANMGPPIAPMDMIDPNIDYMQHQQGMQIPGGGGGGYGQMKEEM